MKLSEVDIDKVVGLSVLGYNGVKGKVVEVLMSDMDEDNSIVIEWENGNVSVAWHFWCIYVEVL